MSTSIEEDTVEKKRQKTEEILKKEMILKRLTRLKSQVNSVISARRNSMIWKNADTISKTQKSQMNH